MSDLELADIVEQHGNRASGNGRHGCLPALVALALIVAIGLFAYVKGIDLMKSVLSGPDDYSGVGHGSVTVEVTEGQTATDVASTLAAVDVVKSEAAFTQAAADDARSGQIQIGCYQLHLQMSGRSAFALLFANASHVPCRGDTQVTVPEGLRAAEILDRIVGTTDLSKAEVDRAFASTTGLGLPSYADGDAEGFLFPATYEVSTKTTADDLLGGMVDKFATEADSLQLEAMAKQLGVTPHEVVVIASLVQAEARRSEDMPKVASVIYNRLHSGMPLQLDSTLHYAVDSRGEVQTSDNLRDLVSRYNTYTHKGLPPTPIDSPGAQAIEAALAPAHTSYLYFVTVDLRTGETRFATTYSEHQRNVALYHQYCATSDAC